MREEHPQSSSLRGRAARRVPRACRSRRADRAQLRTQACFKGQLTASPRAQELQWGPSQANRDHDNALSHTHPGTKAPVVQDPAMRPEVGDSEEEQQPMGLFPFFS